jgi:hypothetical protein
VWYVLVEPAREAAAPKITHITALTRTGAPTTTKVAAMLGWRRQSSVAVAMIPQRPRTMMQSIPVIQNPEAAPSLRCRKREATRVSPAVRLRRRELVQSEGMVWA